MSITTFVPFPPPLRPVLLCLGLVAVASGCDPVDDRGDDELELELDEWELEPPLASPPAGNDEMPPPVERRETSDLPLTADQSPVGYNWTGIWFSDETAPSSCNTGQLLTGIQCSGSYCDDVQLECHDITTRTLAGRIWSGWISGVGWYECPGDRFVSAMACRGDYCDDVAVECTSTYYVPPAHTCSWSGWFSEEDPPFLAPFGTAVRGLQCSGTHCDDKRYYFCTI